MKILLTIHHDLNSNAGTPGVTWQLGQQYQKLGHQVLYYTFDNLPRWFPELAKSAMFPEFVAHYISGFSSKQASIVRDGHDVILIPARDSRAIEQALEKLITDRLYLEMLRRNTHVTAQRYSWSRIARDNLAFYEEALCQSRCS